MTSTQKPSVFIVGKKKKDAPPEPVLSREEAEQCIRDAKALLRLRKTKNL